MNIFFVLVKAQDINRDILKFSEFYSEKFIHFHPVKI